MDTIFPEGTGYEGFFAIGFRKDPNSPNPTQRVGTAILKRTYDINPSTGELMPSGDAFPVFMQDQADNLALNSDFETSLFKNDDPSDEPIDWVPENGAIITQVLGDSDEEVGVDGDFHFLRVSGDANSRVVQTLVFEEPLGGREFTFSFWAGKDPLEADVVQITNARIEADSDSGTVVICDIDRTLTANMTRYSASGVWPAELQATEMRVVLRMSADSSHVVLYNDVQVEERGYLTRWKSATTLLYEHDLGAYKPDGDVIVLGFTGELGIAQMRVNGAVWLTREIVSTSPQEKALFGWEPRNVNPRGGENGQSGTFPTEEDAYPLEDPLPSDFDNGFYNGFRRTNGDDDITESLPASSYLPRGAQVMIDRASGADYTLILNTESVTASYYFFDGTGEDEEANWKSTPFAMNLDTLVLEPEGDACYVVWRGVWPYDQHAEDSYRQLVVKVSE